uniref:Uncharacterized protein n=1 Tax=Parascaris equorum TaxID=6256 RepID=A0A914RZY9_PAREQ
MEIICKLMVVKEAVFSTPFPSTFFIGFESLKRVRC